MNKDIRDYISGSYQTLNTPELRKYLMENFNHCYFNSDNFYLDVKKEGFISTSNTPAMWVYIPTEEFKELIGMKDNINTTSDKNLSKDSKFNLELTLEELVVVRLLVGNVTGSSDFRMSTDSIYRKIFDIMPKFGEVETPLGWYTEIVGDDYEGEYKQMLSELTTNPEKVKLNELKQLLNETKSKISEMEDKLNQ